MVQVGRGEGGSGWGTHVCTGWIHVDVWQNQDLNPDLSDPKACDTTLMAEREEELKSLLMKVKEGSEKDGLKLNI